MKTTMSSLKTFFAFGNRMTFIARFYGPDGKAIACWNVDSRLGSMRWKEAASIDYENSLENWVEIEVAPVIADILATIELYGQPFDPHVLRLLQYFVEAVDSYEYQVEILSVFFKILMKTPG